MVDLGVRKTVEFPDEVEFELEGNMIKVSGPNGELSRNFDLRDIDVVEEAGSIVVSSESSRKKRRSAVGTVVSHIQNMIVGVTEGFKSELKVVYSHFPISVSLEGGCVKIENFVGEEEPRYAEIVGDTQVQIDGEKIELKGPDKEDVGQTAANIEQVGRVTKRDRRVFQDGVYIVERP